uniref:BTB domain-containing protein n=1 Tax=Panagrolaimus superbus TaxID=310955 RepID=A0A914Z0R0_9BILA
MAIKANGILMVEKEILKKSESFGNNRDALCLGLWNQENKDFTIIVDEKEIAAHKCVLAARSPVFAGMKEAEENKVEIKDFPFEIVEAAIKLCYHYSLVPYATLNDKMIILQFFDKYNIQPLKNDLEAELISEIDESNVCLLTNCSLYSNASKLKENCAEFLRDCLESKKPVCDIDILDKDFASNLFKNAFCYVSE